MSSKKKVVLKKKDYSEDFKREAVLTYENSGKSKAEPSVSVVNIHKIVPIL